jgi:hypothetical protein
VGWVERIKRKKMVVFVMMIGKKISLALGFEKHANNSIFPQPSNMASVIYVFSFSFSLNSYWLK